MGEFFEPPGHDGPVEELKCNEQNSMRLLLAYSILLESYCGSSDITFAFKGRSGELRYIQVSISVDMTVQELEAHIRDSLQHPISDGGIEVCSLKALLSVTGSGNAMSDDGPPRKIEPEISGSHFDLAVQCVIPTKGSHVRISSYVNPGTFGTKQGFRIENQFRHILTQIPWVHAAKQRVSEISRASDEDINTIWSWNLGIPRPVQDTVLQAISLHVQQRPEAIAIRAWDGQLTYRELDEISSKLAVVLLENDIGSQNILPLFFEKTLWTPVAILGVLKSGNAFYLVDEDLPQDRVKQLIELVSSKRSIALASAAQQFRASHLVAEVIVVDSGLRARELTVPVTTRMLQPSSSDTCYVIFTSGTTGTPKAAIIQHRNICAFAELLAPKCGVTASSKILALASYAFDVSVGNIFLSLLNGACLCIPSSWECKNDISRAVIKYHVSYAEMTPSVSKALTPGHMPTLEVLNLLGEACTQPVIARWRETQVRVMNTYGPAECTITTVVNENVFESIRPSVIGKGLGATWIVDLTDHKKLCPIGGIGELVIEGPQVGGGYLHNPQMTGNAFLDDPEWLVNGPLSSKIHRSGRLYRTGDLVRYVDEGHIEYIGRRDLQVKVRGQRIELEEVTTHLHKHIQKIEDWSLCVVNLTNGAELLVVFIVAPEVSTQTLSEMLATVNGELAKSLPAAMVPSAWIPIDKIPLSMTGKTDYRILKKIASTLTLESLIFMHEGWRESATAPATSWVEQKLQSLWAKVLNLEIKTISPTSNFFANGGESLSAIKLVSFAAREGISLAVDTVFRHPRLLDMARNCRISPFLAEISPEPFSLIQHASTTNALMSELAEKCATSIKNIEDAFPTTPLQQGMIGASSRRRGAYIGRQVLKIPAHVDPARLVRSWEEVAAAHPILRTRIVETASLGSIQVLLKNPDLSWSTTGGLREHIEEDAEEVVGLGTSLCRWAIVTDLGSTYMLLTMHHALYDGWMLPRLASEVFKAYQGVRLDPYLGFNVFVKHIRDMPLDSACKFWTTYLASPSRSATFPPIPHSVKEPTADSVFSRAFEMPDKSHPGASLATLVRATWALLSATLLGSDDITFGATISGRNVPLAGIDEMMAPAIATVPVRVKLDRTEEVGHYVQRVQEEATAAMPFENVGLNRIRTFNADTREGSRFQTLLIVQPPSSPQILDHASQTQLPDEDGKLRTMLKSLDLSKDVKNFSEYGLMILVSPQHQRGLYIEATFDSQILVESQVELLMEQFAYLLREIGEAKNLTRNLKDLNYASPADIDAVWSWNSDSIKSENRFVHELIAETAANNSQASAICAWDGNLNYGELGILASNISCNLAANHVGRDHVVPICIGKSRWTAVAMVGVLKAGAAFVLLDIVNLPKLRLQGMVNQVGATCIVATSATETLARELLPTGMILLCDELPYEPIQTQTLSQGSVPSDPAFLVFTSGSTGIPKGVFISHENFSTAVQHHQAPLNMGRNTRVYDYASYSFDIAVHNAITTLALGGCLCVPSEHDRQNDIEGSFNRLNANWADLTPSVARLLNPSALPGLETLVLSGEAVGRDIIHQWNSGVQLINAYGPAECQICTIHNFRGDGDESSNIGTAVGCRTWIVDQDTRALLPIGAIGELVIEGPIVSPGYLNMSQASGAAWLRDPSWLSEGSKTVQGRRGTVYRTGDLVRYNPDGSIVFIGRKATQVKINGQRVELGEVEFYLRQAMPTIEDVVVDISDVNDARRLCAFILSRPQVDSFDPSDPSRGNIPLTGRAFAPPKRLKSTLSQYLPQYMIPNLFIEISMLPLTPSAKVDRTMLKALTLALSDSKIEEVNEPTSSSIIEGTWRPLQKAWSQVLGREISSITSNADFFELGGDSLSAMKLVKVCQKLGIPMTVSNILRHSKFEELATISFNSPKNQAIPCNRLPTVQPFSLLHPDGEISQILLTVSSVCNTTPGDIEDIYPCSPIQEGLFTLSTSDHSAYMQHTELKIPDNMSLDSLIAAWEYVFSSTHILRTHLVQSDNAELLQVVLREKPDWRLYKTVNECLLEFGRSAASLGGPLTRLGVVKKSPDSPKSSIVWAIHHSLYDHRTIELILTDVANAYNGMTLSPRPEYNIFIQFICDHKSESITWWKSALQGASLAPAFPKPSNLPGRTRTKSVTERECALPIRVPSHWTIANALKSAWAIIVSRLTGDYNILFGEVRSGRGLDINDLDSIRGPTLATVPVFLQLSPDMSLQELLNKVQELSIEMQPHEHLGLSNIGASSDDAQAAIKFRSLVMLQESQQVQYISSSSGEPIFEVEDRDDIRNFSSYSLMLIFRKFHNGLQLQATSRDSEISSNLVEHLVEQTLALFGRICELPLNTLLHELENVSQDELDQLWSWNKAAPQPVDKFMQDVIAEQVQISPGALAIHAHDGKLTYRELDDYASRLSQQLLLLGIGHGSYVPLCFEKSLWVAVCMLAVIKTGAAFTLLDISHPKGRLSYISEVLNASLVLSSSTQALLAMQIAPRVLVVDDKYMSQAKEMFGLHLGSRKPDRPSPASNIMYVAFTSGSTGVPKGVRITHRNLVSAVTLQAERLGFGPGCRVFDFSSYSFDATIWHHYWALATGSCLCIPSESDRVDNLAGAINAFQSTIAFLTPSLARSLSPEDIPTMQTLFLGGEAVTPLDVSHWRGHVKLVGGYGPTEATPVSIFQELTVPEMASVIGRGIGVVPWIVDPDNHHRLRGVGAIGELILEGPLVGPGYYADTLKTQASFISDPDFLKAGSHSYRGRCGQLFKTGDLARCLHDGSIQYLGRKDTQSKLRGQRIDLGEVEFCTKQALSNTSTIVADIIEADSIRPRLVVFYKRPFAKHTLDLSTARILLADRLPKFMIPENFFALDDIPQTSAGKVDRKALREIGCEILRSSVSDDESESSLLLLGPLTKFETTLMELWTKALGRGVQQLPMSPGLNFFHLGGDSITVMKLSALAAKARLGLNVNSISKNPGLAAMALSSQDALSSRSCARLMPFSMLPSPAMTHVRSEAASLCDVSVEDILDIYPCTPLQEELFALTLKQPEAYMRRCVFDIPQNIDCDRLVRAWNMVIEKHDILRTRFVEVAEFGLLQVVTRNYDWDTADTLDSYLSASRPGPDMGTPLSRWAKIHEKVPKIVWSVHHALYDGWSSQILEEHLRLAFSGEALPEQISFNRFVEFLASQDDEKGKNFWRQYLMGLDSGALFPDLPSKSYQPSPTGCFTRTMNVPSTKHMQTLIHASWTLIVSKFSSNKDVLFGATLTGRNAPLEGLEEIVGPTIAPVPIRIRLPPKGATVHDFIAIIERETESMAPFQHLGSRFIDLISKDTQSEAKFRTLLVVNHENSHRTGDIALSSYEASTDSNNAFHTFPLVLFFTPGQFETHLEVIYDPTVLELCQIERLVACLESVLSQMTKGIPTTLVSDLKIIGKQDLEDIWNWNSLVPKPTQCCVHDLIIQRAHALPHSIAVDAWDIQLTYSQLDEISSALAARLHTRGVGRGDFVPIILPKSGFVPVAALAVLRLGATFIPLDPAQPIARLQAISDQFAWLCSLATHSTAHVAIKISSDVLLLDENIRSPDPMVMKDYPTSFPALASDVACILFTSGSTGAPKGVPQTHQAWASAITHQSALSGFTVNTRAFEFASYTFDVSWNTIFKVLSIGGCLCVPNEDERQNDIAGAINRFNANHTELTPSVARLMNPREITSLKTLILSGEPVDLRDFEHWIPNVHILVAYGPSECTSVSCLNAVADRTSRYRSIGKGAGAVTWLVDPQNHENLVPIGAVGELLLEGPLVGSGYHNNPAQTQSSYIRGAGWLSAGYNHHEGRSATLYKTGDLARYDSSGCLQFVARKDLQVKLRGQRVELEEVQHHILHVMRGHVHSAIACLADNPNGSGDQLLVAFLSDAHPSLSRSTHLIIPAPDVITHLERLQFHLQKELPRYMIPAVYFFVSNIPRTQNDKIDFRRLRELASSSPSHAFRGKPRSAKSIYRAPSSPLAIKLQHLWAAVLKISVHDIGMDDDFFDLNGDSIAAMHLVASSRREGINLSVSDIFAASSLSILTSMVEVRETKDAQKSDVVPFTLLDPQIDPQKVRQDAALKCGFQDPNFVEDVFPCTPLQQAMLLGAASRPGAFTSMRLYRVPPQIDTDRLQDAWCDLVRETAILRTRFADLSECGFSQIVIKEDAHLAFYNSLEEFLLQASSLQLHIGSCMAQWATINCSSETYVVLIVHHAIYDGWTLSLIGQQLQERYHRLARATSYSDMRPFVKYLGGLDTKASVDFWAHELQEAEESTVFPLLPNKTYEPRPEMYLEIRLSSHAQSSSKSVNPSALIQASWSILMSRLTGSNKIAFGTILSGRHASLDGIETVVGPTITTVPILVTLDPSQALLHFMAAFRHRAALMMPHEHLGLANIRRIDNSCAAACNFQTVLVIQPPASPFSRGIDLLQEMNERNVPGFPDQTGILNQYCLMIEVIPDSDGLMIKSSFDGHVLPAPEMKRLVRQWGHIYEQLLLMNEQNNSLRLSDVDTVSPSDLNDIWRWNKTLPLPIRTPIHHLISQVTLAHPDAYAIDSWDGKLTYKELDELSSKLVSLLHHCGVVPHSFVPLLFEKSLWTNVAMLAAHKAGAAFVPLDAEHPEGVLRATMQAIKPKVILCSAQMRDQAARLAPRTLIVDKLLHLVDGLHISEAAKRSQAIHHDDVAYVMFTSGSTGTPKGLRISHGNLSSAIHHQAEALGFGSATRSLDSSSYAFDACIFNFFYTISRGGCLCIPQESVRKGNLSSFIADKRINLAQLTPSVSRNLDANRTTCLEIMILTGEPLIRSDIEFWGSRLCLTNVYGPTECTIMASASHAIKSPSKAKNIGRGLGANLWLTEIGNPSRLAPVGSVGEILIEGPLVGLGYIAQSPSNVQSLVVDPPWLLSGVGGCPGRTGRLFRTGDQGRYDADGSIVFVGRIGSEIKLRGQRVDLAGVEDTILHLLPRKRELHIAVEISQIHSGVGGLFRQALILFVSPIDPCQWEKLHVEIQSLASGLNSQLSDALPSYLKPEALVALEEIPRTLSGKINRRRLSSIAETLSPSQLVWLCENMSRTLTRSAPVGAHEKTLATLWAKVLRIEVTDVYREDSFFKLGGDSLHVMRLTTIAHSHGFSLSTKDVFQTPQLSSLARLMVPLSVEVGDVASYRPFSLLPDPSILASIQGHAEHVLGIDSQDMTDILPANGFQIDYMHSSEEPLGLQYAYLDVSYRISWTSFVSAVRTVVQSFECLRSRFIEYKGRFYQVILREGPLITEKITTTEQISCFMPEFCRKDCRAARINDCYTKLSLVDSGTNTLRIILRLSHMQNDGWCQEQIFKAIATVYNGMSLPDTAPFSRLLSVRAQALDASREYWRSRLSATNGVTPSLILKPAESPSIRTLRTITLPKFHESTDTRMRPTIIINVAWALVLSELLGVSDVVFGNVTTGRNGNMPGLSEVVGPCVNMLPFRLKVPSHFDSEDSLRELANESACQYDERTAYEGLDWDDMVDSCTEWPKGTRYRSAVHYRNMSFYPTLNFTVDPDAAMEQVTVRWNELVATPLWTTILAFPEDDMIRLWVLADPREISDEGADLILEKLSHHVKRILLSL